MSQMLNTFKVLSVAGESGLRQMTARQLPSIIRKKRVVTIWENKI